MEMYRANDWEIKRHQAFIREDGIVVYQPTGTFEVLEPEVSKDFAWFHNFDDAKKWLLIGLYNRSIDLNVQAEKLDERIKEVEAMTGEDHD